MSRLRVEAVDAQTAGDETLLAIHRIEEACAGELATGEPWRSAAEALAFMRHPPAYQRREYWLGFLDDEPAGMAALSTHGEAPLGWVHLRVRPQSRRRGVGRALLAAVRARATTKSLGAHHLTPAGAAFAAAVGARDRLRDVRSALRLREAALPSPQLPPGYVLRSWNGAAPEELVVSYAAARNAIFDAPGLEGEEVSPWTVERVRDLEQVVLRRGREVRVTAALAPDGEVAAYSELRVSPPPSVAASTEDTATVAEQRGRGLSLAVKSESLRLLRLERPDVEVVSTLNAETNAAMRGVNRKLGFVPVATLTSAVLDL